MKSGLQPEDSGEGDSQLQVAEGCKNLKVEVGRQDVFSLILEKGELYTPTFAGAYASETIKKGTSVTVQWTRDDSDPVAFDLAQYQFEGTFPAILSTTPVTASSASETSGAVSVSFDTPGVPIGKLNTPLPIPLSGQQKLTIASGTDGPDAGTTTATAPHVTPPTPTTSTPAVPMKTSNSITAGTLDTATDSAQGTQSYPVEGTSPTVASPQSTNANANSTTGTAAAPERGMPRAAVIALAVILGVPLFALVLVSLLSYWCMRRHWLTSHRIIDLLLAHVRRSAMESASPGLNSGATLPAAGDPEAGAAALVPVAGEKGTLTHLSRPSAPPPRSPPPPSPSLPPSPPPPYMP
ncbi:hypothetical protein GGX14DRAFT_593861 [Mycena pura]|uniref:Uncharacterized protein n=1 Tax=Mycena pura TaxID=153505 RepID=A0AAD6UUA1_9AGAR|nr:hypothetical protein GGX14DRAFT_593861 [Mycena pura]